MCERERERVCVRVCERAFGVYIVLEEVGPDSVCESESERERSERERVFVCVCVSERERERQRESPHRSRRSPPGQCGGPRQARRSRGPFQLRGGGLGLRV